MTERATIVTISRPDWLGRRYRAATVIGTIDRYYPAEYWIHAWTAAGARRAGDRAIRRAERSEAAERRRGLKARRATEKAP
jgi:hypothetical protein